MNTKLKPITQDIKTKMLKILEKDLKNPTSNISKFVKVQQLRGKPTIFDQLKQNEPTKR